MQNPPRSAVFVNWLSWWVPKHIWPFFFSLLFDYLFSPTELVTWRQSGHKKTKTNKRGSISGRVMKMHFSSPTEMLFGRVKWLISHIYRSSPKAATSHSQGAPVSNKTGGCNKMSKQQHVLYVNKSLEVKPERCRIWAAAPTPSPSHQVRVTEYIGTVVTKKMVNELFGECPVVAGTHTHSRTLSLCLHK